MNPLMGESREEREAKLAALREEINAAIAEGGAVGPEEVARELDELTRELKAKGY